MAAISSLSRTLKQRHRAASIRPNLDFLNHKTVKNELLS